MANPRITGITTIVWGTDGVLGSPSGAIVESGTITPVGGTPIAIEGNKGLRAALVQINDGFDAQITCLFDTAKTWPAVQASGGITLTLPTGAYDDPDTPGKVAFACHVIDKTFGVNKKKEATISYKLAYIPNIAP